MNDLFWAELFSVLHSVFTLWVHMFISYSCFSLFMPDCQRSPLILTESLEFLDTEIKLHQCLSGRVEFVKLFSRFLRISTVVGFHVSAELQISLEFLWFLKIRIVIHGLGRQLKGKSAFYTITKIADKHTVWRPEFSLRNSGEKSV